MRITKTTTLDADTSKLANLQNMHNVGIVLTQCNKCYTIFVERLGDKDPNNCTVCLRGKKFMSLIKNAELQRKPDLPNQEYIK